MRAQAYVRTRASNDAASGLIESHAGLVKRIAYHLKARLPDSVDVEDLQQAGMLALLEAAANFERGHGACFATYAGIRIRGAMIDSLRAVDWAPRSVHRKARAAAAAIQAVERRTGRKAREAEIAAELGVNLGEYHRIAQDALQCRFGSLDESDEQHPADLDADPLREVSDQGLRAALTSAIESLPERERQVMSMYYDDELNLKEIGLVLGVSESRVSQIHGQAVLRLRAQLRDWNRR